MTTLAVFMPLLFWPGMVGEFTKFLPIKVIIALSASLAMALLFIPVLGGTITRQGSIKESVPEGVITGRYTRLLERLLHHPGKVLLAALLVIVGAYAAYGLMGNAVQMITNGIKITDYRPDDTDDEVDIRVRFPYSERNLGQLDQPTGCVGGAWMRSVRLWRPAGCACARCCSPPLPQCRD